MDCSEEIQMCFLFFNNYMQTKRSILIRKLIVLRHRLIRALKRRRMRRKIIISYLISRCFVPSVLFSSVVPRFRGYQSKIRQDNFWCYIQNTMFQEEFYETFRMSKNTFSLLCDALKQHLHTSERFVTVPVPMEKKIAICIYRIASCAEYRLVGNVFGVHKSTVHKCFHEVVRAINKLKDEFIKFPDLDEALIIASEFKKESNIPNVIGAIDSTHVPVLPPSDGYLDFINRKGWPSMVMQAVVDHKYIFRDVSIKFPGSVHDATVFKESGLYKNSNTLIPQRTVSLDGHEIPLMLLGDPAYPLLPWLMKPYIGTLSEEEESFNAYLSSARVVVENAFRRLKGRWRCMSKRIDVNPRFVPELVLACTILNNFVEDHKEIYFDHWSSCVQNVGNEQPVDRISQEIIPRRSIDPQSIRRIITNYLSNNFEIRKQSR